MIRSTAISWKIGLAVAILALPSGQVRAQADDEPSATLATPPISLEPKEVPVILLPAASDDVFASRPPELLQDAPIIMVQPARKIAIAQPRPEPAEIEVVEIKEAEIVEAGPKEDAITIVERAPVPEQPPRVALLPPAADAAVATPPPAPEEVQQSAAPVEIPALPGRSPFRQAAAAFKSEIVEIEPKDVAILQQQQASEPAPAKGSAASRFLAKLWPGGDEEETTPGASSDEADTPKPQTAWASTPDEQAETDPASEKPPIKRFLDGIQFWKD